MPRKPKCLCGFCSRAITSKSSRVQCDGPCERWFHAHCIGLNSTDYTAVSNNSFVWICNHCDVHNVGLPNLHSSSLKLDSNLFNTLSVDKDEEQRDDSLDEEYEEHLPPGSPLFSSSPNTSKANFRRKKHPTKPGRSRLLKILNVNCQSIRAKKQTFQMLSVQHKPDIIIGTESWLKESIKDNEVFPTESYNILRRDRPNDPHGGVFIATTKDLLVTRQTDLETECEILWCKLEMVGSKPLFISAFYRPHEHDEDSLEQLGASLSRLGRNSTTLIAGDFNFPGWDWRNNKVQTCRHPTLHHRFGELLDDHGFTQMVEEPTRLGNILDLVLNHQQPYANHLHQSGPRNI